MRRRFGETSVPFSYRDSDDFPRSLNREPSPELRRLWCLIPKLLDIDRKGLCNESPRNFVGALIQQKHLAAIIRLIEKTEGRTLTNDIRNINLLRQPTVVLENVPLYREEIINDRFSPVDLKIVVPRVLYKQLSGSWAGLVLTGPLTGLILEKIETVHQIPPAQGLYANRVWNDDRLGGKVLPAYPNLLTLKDQWGRFAFSGPTINEINQYMNGLFRKYLSGDWASETLVRFLRELKIDFDQKNFQFSREEQIENHAPNLTSGANGSGYNR